MNRKKVQLPSWAEITSANQTEDVAENFAMGSEQPPEDPDFQTLDSLAMRPTSSSNPARPRTTQAGYDYRTETMTIVFRDGTWYDYYNVPLPLWEGFVLAPSKGTYLRESGLDSWPDKGPTNLSKMPKHRKVRLARTRPEFQDRAGRKIQYRFKDGKWQD
jgi:hypothetical protein